MKTAPMILAPAGNRDAFLSAIAAKADAVYCGLKQYSARMEAKNFTHEELAKLIELAHLKGTKVYLTLNSMLRAGELGPFAGAFEQVVHHLRPDALIVQDLSVIRLARAAGYTGEIHLSTLANVSFPGALELVHKNLKINRVVVPRELNIDELKAMAGACPENLSLEVFVHGALCYGVSGRCYWSSYLGGKSGLRGQCVQPCRRRYSQNDEKQKYFSCQDLSLDVLVKVLRNIPQIAAWKIEGRKKSPHYVYYTTTAYRMLRDEGGDAQAKKSALRLLERALGRSGTHFFFLPQRPYNPVDTKRQTGSGLFLGKVSITGQNAVLVPREDLLPGDVLRVGYEDEAGGGIYRASRYVPKKGRYHLNIKGKKKPVKGVPVFLTDRRENELRRILTGLSSELEKIQPLRLKTSKGKLKLPVPFRRKVPLMDMTVYRKPPAAGVSANMGVWLSPDNEKERGPKNPVDTWWWLPPVMWPGEEKIYRIRLQKLIRRGGRRFVLNAPWQKALFSGDKNVQIWAGPFCNIANPLAIDALKSMGFSGVVVSPELSADDVLKLPGTSPLPLGIVVSGAWPLCLSRVFPQELKMETEFISPKKEAAWAIQYDSCLWIYPNWKLDIRSHKKNLVKAGYRAFIHLSEPVPKSVKLKKRPGKWNWDLTLH